MKTRLAVAIFSGLTTLALPAMAVTTNFGGIEFPAGEVSFADVVVSTDTGLLAPTNTFNLMADNAIGVPDNLARSLGRGGNIVLRFTDNALTGSNSIAQDLHIFEVGPDVEDTFVEISTNGMDWLDVGKVFGSTSSIDIDPFLVTEGLDPFTKFSFVRLTDDPNEGGSSGQYVGADIDAVGAISSAPPSVVPLPASLPMLFAGVAGLIGLRRKATKA